MKARNGGEMRGKRGEKMMEVGMKGMVGKGGLGGQMLRKVNV